MYWVSQKVYAFGELLHKKYEADIFKTEMLIYQSKANLDENILFGKITHHLDLKVGKH